jgi:hypothetical protein
MPRPAATSPAAVPLSTVVPAGRGCCVAVWCGGERGPPGKSLAIDTAGQQQQQRWQVPPPSKAMASMTSTVLVLALVLGLAQQGSVPAAISAALATAANQFAPLFFDAFERNQLPDAITRIGIRNLLAARLAEESQPTNTAQQERLLAFVEELKASPIAINTADANEQHYEVPARFYELVLGNFSKYSSALYPPNTAAADASKLLDEAEDRMLAL